MTVDQVAKRVVEAAGQAGGLDEVRRIAERGWSGSVIVASVDAARYEDHDDCLTAAQREAAGDLGLEDYEVTACWDDDGTREEIVIETSSIDVRRAIQAWAQSVVAD